MPHDREFLTDVSQYGPKEEGARLLEPPSAEETTEYRSAPEVAWKALAGRQRLETAERFGRRKWDCNRLGAFLATWLYRRRSTFTYTVLRRIVGPRPAVHTAAGSFFLRGRP